MNARLVVAVGIALAGCVVAVRAINRSERQPTAMRTVRDPSAQPQHSGEHAALIHPVDLPRWDELKFRDMTAEEATAEVATRLKSLREWEDLQVSVTDAEWLISRSVARLAYILEGSPSDHEREAAADGATRITPPDGLSPDGVARLNTWPDVWRNAPLDPGHATVRAIDFANRESLVRSLTPVSSKSGLSSQYASPGVARRTVEVVIPLKPLIEAGSPQRIPVFLGVAYDRLDGGGWRARSITAYYAVAPGGRPIVPPPM